MAYIHRMRLTRNFRIWEFRCHDKSVTQVPEPLFPNVRRLARNLQVLHYAAAAIYGRDVKISIRSGYRTPEHNDKTPGAADKSYHQEALAADFNLFLKVDAKTWEELPPTEVRSLILELIREGTMEEGGIGIYDWGLHYDCRGTRARWDGRPRRKGPKRGK